MGLFRFADNVQVAIGHVIFGAPNERIFSSNTARQIQAGIDRMNGVPENVSFVEKFAMAFEKPEKQVRKL